MTRLKSKLMSINKNTGVKVYSPENTRELRIPFKQEKTAKVVGKLAQMQKPSGNAPDDTQLVSGVLVQNDFKLSLMAPEDLKEYAGLTTTTLICKQHITLSAAGIDLIRWALAGTFGAIEEIDGPANGAVNGDWKTNGEDGAAHGEQDDGNGEETDAKHDAADEEAERGQSSFAFLVMGCVKVLYEGSGQVTVEWEGNVMNDGVADAVLAVLFTVETSPAAVKRKPAPARCLRMLTVCRVRQERAAPARARPAQSARRRRPRGAPLAAVHDARGAVWAGADPDREAAAAGQGRQRRERHRRHQGRARRRLAGRARSCGAAPPAQAGHSRAGHRGQGGQVHGAHLARDARGRVRVGRVRAARQGRRRSSGGDGGAAVEAVAGDSEDGDEQGRYHSGSCPREGLPFRLLQTRRAPIQALADAKSYHSSRHRSAAETLAGMGRALRARESGAASSAQ